MNKSKSNALVMSNCDEHKSSRIFMQIYQHKRALLSAPSFDSSKSEIKSSISKGQFYRQFSTSVLMCDYKARTVLSFNNRAIILHYCGMEFNSFSNSDTSVFNLPTCAVSLAASPSLTHCLHVSRTYPFRNLRI